MIVCHQSGRSSRPNSASDHQDPQLKGITLGSFHGVGGSQHDRLQWLGAQCYHRLGRAQSDRMRSILHGS